LGRLKRNDRGKYELIIGNHVLEGTAEALKKPLVIFEPLEETVPFQGDEDLRSHVCSAIGIVRERLLFKTRPNIVVGALGDDFEYDSDESKRRELIHS
jgi:hypothetical protein